MSISYFPRISDTVACSIIEEMVELSLEELGASAATHHAFETYHSTSNEKVSTDVLASLRAELVTAAHGCGFPESSTDSNLREFDQIASKILYGTNCNLIPTEAANQEVWNFLTTVLLPDLAKWRYPNESKNLEYPRWLGTPRNVFRKLWWREATLGRELNSQLGEDEAVGIMERTQIAGHPSLSRAAAKALFIVSAEYPNIARSELARAAMVNVRRRFAIIDYSIFEEPELNEKMIMVYRESAAAYSKSKID